MKIICLEEHYLDSELKYKSIISTEAYTKVFTLNVAARLPCMQFHMPSDETLALLKGKLRIVRDSMRDGLGISY